MQISFWSALKVYFGQHSPATETSEAEPGAAELMVPAAEHTEKVVLPLAASVDSSASELSGKRHPEASNTPVEAATLH